MMSDTKILKKDDWNRRGLPGWTYKSDALFDLEAEELFRRHWQFVCHVNALEEVGSFKTIDRVNERGFVIRDKNHDIKAFHNLCRHRGSRVLGEAEGICKRAIFCPYHGWSYNFDGTVRGIPNKDSFGDTDFSTMGLRPLDMEIWHGLIFVRFKTSNQKKVSEILKRFNSETCLYRLDEMIPVEGSEWTDFLDANWKSVRDVDNEGYHVPQAHPALFDLYGQNYQDEPFNSGTSRSIGTFNLIPSKKWSVKNYRKIVEQNNWLKLPELQSSSWVYLGMFPNFVLGFYPDCVIYYYEYPLSATKTIQKGGVLRHRQETREQKIARYLSGRIDRDTAKEDQMLVVWSSEAVKSSAFSEIHLSDLEYGVKSYHDHLRKLLPVVTIPEEPSDKSLSHLNSSLLGQGSG
tara:strand:+ start:49 stop:1260 length:1212 start_codon:yes stop_codon:yes gene_type:complete